MEAWQFPAPGMHLIGDESAEEKVEEMAARGLGLVIEDKLF
jgi:hypothetical protein